MDYFVKKIFLSLIIIEIDHERNSRVHKIVRTYISKKLEG